jgi:multidrug efflux pump subunit AcrB
VADIDPRLRVVWDEALRGVDQQAETLNEVRTRAGTIVSASSIVAAFLVPLVLTTTATYRPGVWAWVGVGAFIVASMLCAVVLVPWRGWRFSRAPSDLLAFVDDPEWGDPDKMMRQLAEYLEADYTTNGNKLGRLLWCLTLAVASMIVEIVSLGVAVTYR